MDELYENLFVGKALYGWMWRFLAWFDSDKGVVDRAVNTLGLVGRNVGKGIRVVENGQLQMSHHGAVHWRGDHRRRIHRVGRRGLETCKPSTAS